MSEYRKGPWSYKLSTDGRRYSIRAPMGSKIGSVSQTQGFGSEATAALISAAPELYEACKRMLKDLNLIGLDESYPVNAARAMKAAIEKAEGRKR